MANRQPLPVLDATLGAAMRGGDMGTEPAEQERGWDRLGQDLTDLTERLALCIVGTATVLVLAAFAVVGRRGEWTWSARVGVPGEITRALKPPTTNPHLLLD